MDSTRVRCVPIVSPVVKLLGYRAAYLHVVGSNLAHTCVLGIYLLKELSFGHNYALGVTNSRLNSSTTTTIVFSLLTILPDGMYDGHMIFYFE